MRTFSTLAAFSALARAASAQGSTPIINTPAALVQCQPALLSFSGGTAPYFLSILPGGQVGAVPLEFLPNQAAAGSYTWTVNLAAGTNITFRITDNAGLVNYAAPVVIQAGPSSACLNATANAAASSAGATAAVGGATSAPASIATSAAASSTLITSAPAATVTAGAGAITGNITQNNGTSSMAGSYNFTCSTGQLTYGITTAMLQNATLRQATSFFRNWTAAAPGTLVSSNGTGVGATRAFTFSGVTFNETLRTNETNATSGSLHQQWNSSTPLTIPGTNLTLSSYFQDLTVYTNATANSTEVQYFILGCLSDQAEGATILAQAIEAFVTYWSTQIVGVKNGTATTVAKARRAVQLF